MIKLVDINSVKPSTYNPRKADPRRLELTELSLRKLGFVLPIYADQDGEILSGHQRHLVSKKIGLKQVPVVFIEKMELEKRKAINILFNRATNDFNTDDTTESVTDRLKNADVFKLAARLKDIKINTPEFYPCLNTKTINTIKIIKANTGRLNRYSRNVSASLYAKKIFMPVVATADLKIINGIGRTEVAAERKLKTIPVVILDKIKSQFAEAMLNLLSMDFDIHTKYENLLRYNSFRRAFTTRAGLGIGFFVGAFGRIRSKDFNLDTQQKINKWKAFYGTTVLDFGAGHLKDTDILGEAGISVTPFEPYKIKPGTNEIDKDESLKLSKLFLADLNRELKWNSIFISSVLNSVPFLEDRKHIVKILAACCTENTRVHVWAMSVNHKSHYSIDSQPLSRTDAKQIRFKLGYEPGIVLGSFSDKPKVQKYHTPAEIKELFSIGFKNIQMKVIDDSILALCSGPIINKTELNKAIEFEFNLPYPDGTTMNLVNEAKSAFKKRGVL